MNSTESLRSIPASIWLLSLLFMGLTAIYGTQVPLNSDEALYWQHGRHLDWGFYTHPPMTGFLIHLSTSLFGDTLLGIRIFSSFLGGMVLVLIYLISWESTRDRYVSSVSVLIYLLLPMSFGLGVLMVTDVPLLFFHSCFVFFLRRAIIDESRYSWLLAGLTGGLMMQSKFLGAVTLPGILLFFLFNSKYRKCLLQIMPYLGLLVSLFVLIPFAFWNQQNDWINLQFLFKIRTQDDRFSSENLVSFLISFFVVYTPVFSLLLLTALLKNLFRQQQDSAGGGKTKDSLILFSWIHAGVFGAYTILSLRHPFGAHWLAFLQPLSAVLLAYFLVHFAKHPMFFRWVRVMGVVFCVPLTFAIYVAILHPQLLPDQWRYMQTIHDEPKPLSHYFGWEQVGKHVAELLEENKGEARNIFLSSKDYGLASLLSFYTPGQPDYALFGYEEAMHGREYLEWSRPLQVERGDTLMVSDSPNTFRELQSVYDEVLPLEPLEVRDEGGLMRVFYFHLGIRMLEIP